MAWRPGPTQNTMDTRPQTRWRKVSLPLSNTAHLRINDGKRWRAVSVGIKADGAYKRGDYGEDIF